jgi:chromosome segregation ATPase
MTDPDEIKAEIDRTRADLAETVDALTSKLDVKAHARQRAAQAQAKVGERLQALTASAPPQVQQALARAGEMARPVAAKAAEDKRRTAVVAGAVGMFFVLARARRRRRRHAVAVVAY